MTANDCGIFPAAPDLDRQTLFVGGRLCLDFINTRCRRKDSDLDLIGSTAELRLWLREAEQSYPASLVVEDDEAYWQAALPRAVALREALRELVTATIEAAPLPAAALDQVNAVLRENPSVLQVEASGGGVRRRMSALHPRDAWMTAIAEDITDLLSDGDLSLLRCCAHPPCIRVFYDTTKNHRRRWCVDRCGSHTKAAAYYRRKVAKLRDAGEQE